MKKDQRERESMENRRGFRSWHTHGRTGAVLFVPAPPRLEGASNLLENQINLAAGCRTLSLSLSLHSSPLASILLPSCSHPPHFSLFLSIFSRYLEDTSKSKARDRNGGEEGGGP